MKAIWELRALLGVSFVVLFLCFGRSYGQSPEIAYGIAPNRLEELRQIPEAAARLKRVEVVVPGAKDHRNSRIGLSK